MIRPSASFSPTLGMSDTCRATFAIRLDSRPDRHALLRNTLAGSEAESAPRHHNRSRQAGLAPAPRRRVHHLGGQLPAMRPPAPSTQTATERRPELDSPAHPGWGILLIAIKLVSCSVTRPPLSVRQNEDALAKYQEPHDGIPPWMHSGVREWVDRCIRSDAYMRRAEQVLRVELDWVSSRRARNALLSKLRLPGPGLDLLDYCLYECAEGPDLSEDLEPILENSGSAWKVGSDSDGHYCLEKRVDRTVEGAARREMAEQSNAATHLRSAWHHAYRRNPDPSKAYSESIKAVEAAARPVVSPKDQLATLGKMIGVMKATPQKWGTVIGAPDDVDTVRMMMNTIWKGQVDRHGTSDPNRDPVTQPAAEAAVQIGLTLVHLFRTGTIHSVP